MLSQYTDEWLRKQTIAFGQWNNLQGGLVKLVQYVKTIQSDVTFENCDEFVQQAKMIFNSTTNFNANTSHGHDFFEVATHQQTELETRHTGYKFIDQCLKGGWANKTLNVFMGSPKVGKSMWLCNLCANAVRNGENSAYITLEMAYQLVAQRIGANLFNIPIDQYDAATKDGNYMLAKMKEYYQNSLVTPGKFIIEEFPTSSATVYDIEAFLLKLEEELSTDSKPFKFKNIFIDYVNIMKDAKNPNSENMYLKIKSICEDVRAMAQRNNWCVVSLTQTNRSAYDSSDIGMSNVSESGGLIATVDSLFGIIQSSIMRTENTYYIKAVAIRNSGHMGDKKKFDFNPKYLRIEENTTEDIIPENVALENLSSNKNNKNFNQNNTNFNNQQNKQTQYQYNGQNVNIKTNMVPNSGPTLGLTEAQLNTQDLFTMS